MTTTGSDFLAALRTASLATWEQAFVEVCRQDGPTPWAWASLPLTDGVNTVELQVMTDGLAVGTLEDHIRLPLRPGTAQDVCNMFDWLLPTPWLVYQTWRAASIRVPFRQRRIQPPTLPIYAEHSAAIDADVAAALAAGARPGIVSGGKKDVVVSNLHKPGVVLIFGAYLPDGPDVYSNGLPMGAPGRHPLQPESNAHGDFYADYSHEERPVQGACLVNGRPDRTERVYQDPVLSKLVSHDGPVRVPRYPSRVAVNASVRPVGPPDARRAAIDAIVPRVPDPGTLALADTFWRKD